MGGANAKASRRVKAPRRMAEIVRCSGKSLIGHSRIQVSECFVLIPGQCSSRMARGYKWQLQLWCKPHAYSFTMTPNIFCAAVVAFFTMSLARLIEILCIVTWKFDVHPHSPLAALTPFARGRLVRIKWTPKQKTVGAPSKHNIVNASTPRSPPHVTLCACVRTH